LQARGHPRKVAAPEIAPQQVQRQSGQSGAEGDARDAADQAQAEGDPDPKATLLDKYGWHTGNAAGNDPEVGVLAPNPWGLYDMHGYLWELCSDPWKPTPEGQAATDGTHAMRGGSWKDPYPKLACSSRAGFKLVAKDDAVGFRCVRAAVK
jgi:formylglycine-generating enzyme required for sulfatase activity